MAVEHPFKVVCCDVDKDMEQFTQHVAVHGDTTTMVIIQNSGIQGEGRTEEKISWCMLNILDNH